MAVGPILILLALFVVGPIGLFIVGGLFSAAHGQLEVEAAEKRANAPAEEA
jgi:hypothetical protein